MLTISSTQNPKIKELITIQEKSAYRRKSGLFVIEGTKELRHAIEAGIEIVTIFCKSPQNIDFLETHHLTDKCFCVSDHVYSRIAYRDGSDAVIAIAKRPILSLNELKLSASPLVIVLETVEKPGNLGAVLRTADAVKADAVIICDPTTDIYNPNVIRSSVGAVFTTKAIACTSEEAYKWLSDNSIQILTAQLQNSVLYYEADLTLGTALVMGTESTGLTNFWRDRSNKAIRIPMLGQMDSLNVSVSTAILAYEIVRQRN